MVLLQTTDKLPFIVIGHTKDYVSTTIHTPSEIKTNLLKTYTYTDIQYI